MKIFKVPNEAIIDRRAFIGEQEGHIAYFATEDGFFTLPCILCDSSYLKGFTEVACGDERYAEIFPRFLYGLEQSDWKNWIYDESFEKLSSILSVLESTDRKTLESWADSARQNKVSTMKIPAEFLNIKTIRWDENSPKESIDKRCEIRLSIGGIIHRVPVDKDALGYSRSRKTFYLDIARGEKRDCIIDLPEGRILAPVSIDDIEKSLKEAVWTL